MTQAQIIHIPRQRLEEATEVLARAFENYPMMNFFFEGSDKSTADIREAFRFTCVMRLELDDHLIGMEMNNRLVAVACLNKPERPEWPASLQRELEKFQQSVGPSALERFAAYGELSEKHAQSEPHFYLVAIGVHPDAQGKGYGKMLLNEAQRLSQRHPTSVGVALDTETASNVALYEHCGYQITAQANLGELPVWFMLRRNRN